jgi:exodeoxyribonuclease VII large subunit
MKSLTVSEITKLIKNLIESHFNEVLSIEGEVSNLSRSPSGHLYFVLKDENAQIRVALFKKFLSLNRGYIPKNGDHVVVIGDLTVYEADGSYQILARKVEYKEIGLFYKKFEETRNKLEQEGLFDKLKKKQLPLLVKRLAVLTSPGGAAIKDFLKILKDNGINLHIHLWPVQVQGAQAVPEIVSALKKVDNFSYDVVVLMRGGGSLEDLAIFNDELIARAIFELSTPLITAIGHERDITIADFVSDIRAPTPTAAANVIVETCRSLVTRIDELKQKLTNIMDDKFFNANQKLDILSIKLDKHSPHSKLQRIKDFLQTCSYSIKNRMQYKIKELGQTLEHYEIYLKSNSPQKKVIFVKKEIELIRQRLIRSMEKKRSYVKESLNKAEFVLKSIDPKNILKKGYSIVRHEGKIVTDVRDVHLEDILEITVKNGYIKSSVTAKKLLEE